MSEPAKLYVSSHPLVAHRMGMIRDAGLPGFRFRELVGEIALLLGVEATRDLPLKESAWVQTPFQRIETPRVADDRIVVAPILRAGLAMTESILKLLPRASVAHVGVARNEATLEPEEYYFNAPSLGDRTVIVLDPMVGTGGSASAALSLLKQRGATDLRMIAILGAPEGLRRLAREHPDTAVFIAEVDSGLNRVGFIVPGLGDAGDRAFGTE